MYIVVRRYEGLSKEATDELAQCINESFVPTISQVPGFVAYYAMRACGSLASVSIFADRCGAEESNKLATGWVRQAGPYCAGSPVQVLAGELLADTVNGMALVRQCANKF